MDGPPTPAGRTTAINVDSQTGHTPSSSSSITEQPLGSKPYLEFQKVSISFGSNQVLNEVSFAVRRQETLCIMGRSGVGKSVCLQILMGFLKPDSGRVIVAGEDITDYSNEQLEHIRKKVTIVFQDGALFSSLSVRENVAYALRERTNLSDEQIHQRVDQLLDMVGIQSVSDRLSEDISTGLKRSVAIARALAENPEAVLYDEPTTMVDPFMSHRLTELINNLKLQLKLTSVVVTHDTRLAEMLADDVLFLDKGKVAFIGTKEEMTRSFQPLVREFLTLDRSDLPLLEKEASDTPA